MGFLYTMRAQKLTEFFVCFVILKEGLLKGVRYRAAFPTLKLGVHHLISRWDTEVKKQTNKQNTHLMSFKKIDPLPVLKRQF